MYAVHPDVQCLNTVHPDIQAHSVPTIHQVYSIQCIKSFCCDPIFCYVSPSSSPHRVTKFNAPQIAHCNAFQCTVAALQCTVAAMHFIGRQLHCILLHCNCNTFHCTVAILHFSALFYISFFILCSNCNCIATYIQCTAMYFTAL